MKMCLLLPMAEMVAIMQRQERVGPSVLRQHEYLTTARFRQMLAMGCLSLAIAKPVDPLEEELPSLPTGR